MERRPRSITDSLGSNSAFIDVKIDAIFGWGRAMISDILEALMVLGLPVFLVSWYLFRRLHLRGDVRADSSYGTIKSDLKSLKKQKHPTTDFFHKTWMKFGGGFYGVTAVVTLLLIEAGEVWQLVFHFPGLEALFAEGFIALLISLIINQVQNVIAAAVWFVHWSGGGRNTLIWIAVAYGSYYLGMRTASRPIVQWLDAVRSRFSAKC